MPKEGKVGLELNCKDVLHSKVSMSHHAQEGDQCVNINHKITLNNRDCSVH